MNAESRARFKAKRHTAIAMVGIGLLVLSGSAPPLPAESYAPIIVIDFAQPPHGSAEVREQNRCLYENEDACRYYPIVQGAAERHEVETSLVLALIHAESNYNPHAVSSQGAQGLMQLMPRTAESLGVEDAFDPQQNVDAGARYLKRLLKAFKGDREKAVAAYLAGPQSILLHGGIPPVPSTRAYVRKVVSLHEHYRGAQRRARGRILAAADSEPTSGHLLPGSVQAVE